MAMNGLAHLYRSVNPDAAPGAVQYSDFVVLFLFFLLVLILLVAGLFVWMARNQVRHRRLMDELAARSEALASLSGRIGFPFVQPACWLAVCANDTETVTKALGLRNATPCSWEDGMMGEHSRRVFVSPPVDNGWVLVVGRAVPNPFDDPDACFHFLKSLSEELGEVQWFAVNRALHHHAWVRMIGGQVLRAYVWAGETLWHEGRPTRAEQSLGMNYDEYGDPPRHSTFGLSDIYRLNTEKVNQLASKWSVDPCSLTEKALLSGNGMAGNLY